MPWWTWVAVALTWLVVGSGFALWLGAAAAVVQRREHPTAGSRDVPAGWEHRG